ncbi:MAG: HlyD family efflux transporter periplasmic adaptor subunit [Mariniblastus sp.]
MTSKRPNWILRSLLILGIGLGCYGIYWGATSFGLSPAGSNDSIPTATVKLMNLRDKVVEQGELKSQSTVTGVCQIDHHENKIIFLAPEGSKVKKGQVVCKFDSSQFEEYVSERESRVNESQSEVEAARQQLIVQKDENESSIRAAEQAVEFAELDLNKYKDGDYKVTKSGFEFEISEAETNLEKVKRKMENIRVLVKRGFSNAEAYLESQQQVRSAEIRVTRDRQKLATLENFQHKKSLAEYEGKFKEAKHKLTVAKTTAEAKLNQAKDKLKNEERGLKIQTRRLKEYQKSLDAHIMVAPQDGTLAFANNDWRGNGEKLHEGAMVYQNQPVFVLPDMSRMEVKLGIHESLVSKIKPGQRAIVRVDAFSSFAMKGRVKSVSPLSASTRWEPSNNYTVVVTIDEIPEGLKLKPDMTAKAEIVVGQYDNILAVPIQAVASFGRKKFVFVENSNREFEPQEVSVGNSNISFVEIESGVDEGDVVALDAYQRALTAFGDQEPEVEDDTDQLVAEMTEAESKVGQTSEEEADSDLPPRPPTKKKEPESNPESTESSAPSGDGVLTPQSLQLAPGN